VNKQMVGSEGVKHSVDGNKCTGFLLLEEFPGGLFIWVVRGSDNNVRTPPPPNHPVHIECTVMGVMGALQSFPIPNYFT
jgi:hypothetical protein